MKKKITGKIGHGTFIIFVLFLTAGSAAGSPQLGDNMEFGAGLETGDPISAGSGGYRFHMPLLNVFLGIIPVNFGLMYGSDFCGWCVNMPPERDVPLPFWWSPKFAAAFSTPPGGENLFTVQMDNGDVVSFKKTGDEWELTGAGDNFWEHPVSSSRMKYVLKETTETMVVMDPIRKLFIVFEKYGAGPTEVRVLYVKNRDGEGLSYNYVDESRNPSSIFTYISGPVYGRLIFTYGTDILGIATVADGFGRQVTFQYEYDAVDNGNKWTLRSVTDAMGNTTAFRYAGSDRISSRQLPMGNTPVSQTYDDADLDGTTETRVTLQMDAYEHRTTLGYDPLANRVTEQRPDGNTVIYEHNGEYGPPKAVTDAAGRKMNFTINSDQQITQVGDRLGDSTNITYHPETGYPATVTNARGDTVTYSYTAQEQTFWTITDLEEVTFTFYNLTRIDYPDGTNEQFTHDSEGHLLTRTDRGGKAWTYTYNTKGQIKTVTNPSGGVTTYTYVADLDSNPKNYPVILLAASTDSDRGTTTYDYDTYYRLQRITHPDDTYIEIIYDLNDRLTAIRDENNHTYTYTYDANGNLTVVTDPANNQTQYAYDLMDRVTQITNRLNQTATLAYDNMGRAASISDPGGISIALGYDPRGWLNSSTIDGKTWQTTYDDEGIATSTQTPLINTTTYQSDSLGRIEAITNPLGQTTTVIRDKMGRITGITDPLNRTITYGYDNRGLLASVTTPGSGTAAFARNDLGLLEKITDPNGNDWTFGYTNMGRLSSITTPLAQTTGYNYDSRGRLSRITYADASTMDRTYDQAENVVRRLYSDGTDHQYTHDALNRIVTVSAGGGAPGLQLTRDAESRITSTNQAGTNFGASYDNSGRLATATYNNDTFTVAYTYHAATGQLSRVTDSLTGAGIDFTYDNDGRLTGMTRANGVNTAYTYDGAGQLTGIQDGSIIDLRYILDGAGQVVSVDMNVPLNPETLLVPGTDTVTCDEASRVSTAGYEYDARGRLMASPGHSYTWDGASRLTGIDDTVLVYNGLGDLVIRDDTHFYYNRAIGLKPIVGEKSGTTGSFLRYYVWTPGGSLLYMIDASDSNAVYYYHFDRTGSTLALTNAAGTVTDSYAYTPYGRSIGHNGSSQQPFTFVGQWGVRHEGGDSALYHMRARYYDAVTGRFISPDPVWPVLGETAGLNPYQYSANEPIGNVDVTGLSRILLSRRERDWLTEEFRTMVEGMSDAEFMREWTWFSRSYEIDILDDYFRDWGVIWGMTLGNLDAFEMRMDEYRHEFLLELFEEEAVRRPDSRRTLRYIGLDHRDNVIYEFVLPEERTGNTDYSTEAHMGNRETPHKGPSIFDILERSRERFSLRPH
ncbi:MAG: RHS repeat-associated core domain-containing protein [Desulfatirhabdiaceae bacterium]